MSSGTDRAATASPGSTVAHSRRRVALTAGTQLAGRTVGVILGVGVAAALARGLGADDFGQFALATSLAAVGGNLTDFGVAQVAIREMARDPDGRPQIVGGLFLLRLALSIVVGAAFFVVAVELLPDRDAVLMAVLVLATLPLGAFSALNAAAQARLRSEIVTLVLLVQSAFWLAAVLALVAADAPLAAYGGAFFVSQVVQAVVLTLTTRRVTGIRVRGALPVARRLLGQALPLGVAGLAVTAYYKLDSILVFEIAGARENAFYAAAYRFLDALQVVPMTAISVFVPVFMRFRAEDRRRAASVHRLGTVLLMAVAVPIAACGAVLAPTVADLVYGDEYVETGVLLRIMLPAFVGISLGYVATGILVAEHLVRPYLVIAVTAAILNVALNLALIPRYGATAAAWVTLATEFGVAVALLTVVRQRLSIVFPLDRLVRILAAAMVAAGAAWLLVDESLIISTSVAVVVYIALAARARVLRRDEVTGLLSARRDIHA